jgi:hypothetical protein
MTMPKDKPEPFDGEVGLDSGLDHQDPDAVEHHPDDVEVNE